MPANRTLRVISFSATTSLPQAVDQIRDEDWGCLVELNLTSCVALTRNVVPFMKERICRVHFLRFCRSCRSALAVKRSFVHLPPGQKRQVRFSDDVNSQCRRFASQRLPGFRPAAGHGRHIL